MRRMTLARRLLAPVLALALVAGSAAPARAQDAAIEQARVHFETGQRLYEKSEFGKAAEEFMAAYEKKPFPAFLFNAAACRENLKEFDKAIDLLERYLREDPKAGDKAEVEQWISSLKASKAAPPTTPPPPTPDATGNAPPPPPPAQPERAAPRTKGLTVIESYPEGATIRVDSEGAPELGKTTWSGQLPDGKHTIYLDKRGFKTESKVIQPSTQAQFAYYFFRLSEDPEFGFLVVTSNIPDALIYLDDQPGIWGRVSSERNLKKGKHKIKVTREGYQPKELEIDIKAGQLNTIPVQLEVAKTGFLRVRTTENATGAKVTIDGKEACAEIPCRVEAPEGDHDVAIVHNAKKGFARSLHLERFTEATLTVKLVDKPARWPAALWFVGAAAAAGGGVAAGLFLDEKTATGIGFPGEGPTVRIVYFGVGGALAVLFIGLGINELVRDKGPPSTGTLEMRDLSWVPIITPHLGPTYAGAGATWRF